MNYARNEIIYVNVNSEFLFFNIVAKSNKSANILKYIIWTVYFANR